MALRALQRLLVLLDAPISAVSVVLPLKGLGLFFVPAGYDRGIAPDVFAIFVNQLIIGIPTYLVIFWLAGKLWRLIGSGRAKRASFRAA